MGDIDIFVLALDDGNLRTLEQIPDAERFNYHRLLGVEETQEGQIPIEDLLHKAQQELDGFDGKIGAIVGYWDFPVTALVPMLCRERGLPSADLEAVVKCEHKYWSRLEQSKVVDDLPKFGIVDLAGEARLPEGMRYPVWLKPVKSFSSELAFHVADDREFEDAVAQIREGVSRVGKPFEFVLDQVDLPPEIAEIGGQACLAEEALTGVQAATEGYVYQGKVTVNGALDSINYPDTPCFLRHQYPSQLPAEFVERMTDISERVITQMGLNNSTFSIEFFCDLDTGRVSVLEINARHSQSHADMFLAVDGIPNHHCMIRLGLGMDPSLPRGEGPYEIAAKWYYRRFTDGIVRRVPAAAEIEAIQRDIPGVTIEVTAAEGTRLSDAPAQDSYSYELADLFIGADSEAEMTRKYERCVDALHFEFEDVEE
ncbi:ATP-grasp domain-containing protein [Nocardia blacklockiae]|uniref:ATP-grasp domain-containing protein n=1 Tax=Nocardia blacklockiae TaxID=480036 RepID=UPI001894C9F8|nr:ATP-grasp domain-containing protein [Nocardia blacklockiae]MBF6171907.1 ATP-grasp domain-containing protein [Nocardia blacklockiae]